MANDHTSVVPELIRKSPVNDPRKSPIPGWTSMKGIIKQARGGRATPTQDQGENETIDIFCDEPSVASKSRVVKSVRPSSSRRRTGPDLKEASPALNRTKRIERTRMLIQNSKKQKSRDRLQDSSASITSSALRSRNRSKSRSPVGGSIEASSPKRRISKSGSQSKSQDCHAGEEEDTLISQVSVLPVNEKKQVKWSKSVKKSSRDDCYDDDITESGTLLTAKDINFAEELFEEFMECSYFCRCLVDEVNPNKTNETTVEIK